ncbi:centromere protein U isoform X2 [Microcaecilia unicolor]|uniref:Centromere protein U n=1 Tax=Microcaecilia unicolor TaxID=1415580 RepID=A0A6P7XE86_9AMPH|nr:centromere protein U isoform X2 [Microcaecilia unicolor]
MTAASHPEMKFGSKTTSLQKGARHIPARIQNDTGKAPQSRKMLLSPDVSRILRIPEDGEPEEFYDHPLHSTAVVDDHQDRERTQCNMSPNIVSKSWSQAPGAENSKISKHLQKSDTSERKLSRKALIEPTMQEARNSHRKTKAKVEESPFTSLKTRSIGPGSNDNILDSGSKNDGPVESGNPGQSTDDPTPNSKNLSETPADTGASVSEDGHQERKSHLSKKDLHLEGTGESSSPRMNVKSKGKKRKKSTRNKSSDSTDDAGSSYTTILSPEGIQRSSKYLTELDVVLDRFETVITNYKQTEKSSSVRKAIDLFFSTMKKQLNRTSEDVHRLKNLKKKNAKMHIEINKKRRRLIDVKEELIVNELKQQQLLREYNDLEQKMSSFRNATQFLHDLQELQRTYLNYKEQNKEEKEEYGISSLPALLLEARSVLEAEKHLQNINKKLQHWLNLEKESENLIQKV